jgi:hypothetical protein
VRTTVQKLQRMFGVEVQLKTPKVPYRETVTRRAENVEGKLKKQSGGKGMYGVCYLTVEPRPRGEGIEFVEEIVGGAIPRNLIPAVEKGVLEACRRALAGFRWSTSASAASTASTTPVDSNEMAFKLAGSFGFKPPWSSRLRPVLARADHERRVSAHTSSSATSWATSPAGAARAVERSPGHDGSSAPSSDVGDARVRRASSPSMTGARRVPHGVLALRRGAGERARQDRR